jgi:hypothetical protein
VQGREFGSYTAPVASRLPSTPTERLSYDHVGTRHLESQKNMAVSGAQLDSIAAMRSATTIFDLRIRSVRKDNQWRT